MKEVALLKHLIMEEFKMNEPVYEFRFLKESWIGIIGLLKFCWLVMVLLASFIYKRLIFIPKLLQLLKLLQSMNKRPQFYVIRYEGVSFLVQKSVWRSSESRVEYASKAHFWCREILRICTKSGNSNNLKCTKSVI